MNKAITTSSGMDCSALVWTHECRYCMQFSTLAYQQEYFISIIYCRDELLYNEIYHEYYNHDDHDYYYTF